MKMNRRVFVERSAVPLFSATLLGRSAPGWKYSETLKILEGERWWAGIITDSFRMPLSQAPYSFNFDGENAGNQVQPLLVSNMGRFVWSEEPFQFSFENGSIQFSSDYAPPQTGTQGNTLREVYRYVSRTFFPPSGKMPDPLLFSRPQYNTWIELTYNQNQKDILEYAHKAIENGFPAGVIMIDEGWEKTHGDWDFDRAKFPDPIVMIRELHDLGYKVMLWVCPFLTPEGAFYKSLYLDHINKKRTIWLLNRNDPNFPVITSWWDGFSALLDLTNPQGVAWFKEQLDRLTETYEVDGFKFDGGDTPYYTERATLSPILSHREDAHPNDHTEAFARVGLDYPFNEYRACWKMGGQPLVQRLRDKEHTWIDLTKLLPGLITQGLMGYTFICPDLIGGGEYLSFMNLSAVDQELIVRAAQCHALAPMMQFSVAPWRVLNPENLEICRRMAVLHTEMADVILELASESARTGEPIIRSLEYEYPHKGYVDITDQFLLGDRILVAPVVTKGARRRIIHFPEGRWEGDDGTLVIGPVQQEVEVPLTRLPWYRKIS